MRRSSKHQGSVDRDNDNGGHQGAGAHIFATPTPILFLHTHAPTIVLGL